MTDLLGKLDDADGSSVDVISTSGMVDAKCETIINGDPQTGPEDVNVGDGSVLEKGADDGNTESNARRQVHRGRMPEHALVTSCQ